MGSSYLTLEKAPSAPMIISALWSIRSTVSSSFDVLSEMLDSLGSLITAFGRIPFGLVAWPLQMLSLLPLAHRSKLSLENSWSFGACRLPVDTKLHSFRLKSIDLSFWLKCSLTFGNCWAMSSSSLFRWLRLIELICWSCLPYGMALRLPSKLWI